VAGHEGDEEEAEKGGRVGKPWGKANPIIPRPAVYAVWAPFRLLKAGDKRPAAQARAAPATPPEETGR
jgi:hypothetical protein